ncbi:MAG: cyclic nucleotide-binding domain-containing protein [Rhodospirillaceae bacterium]|nr:cyclic nucleotide-binding domain-containing protein [Rhodospirillaceae bacterium]
MAEHYAIAIVGSGPAGLSAAGRAAKRGASYVLLERTTHLSDTIYKYQKKKHVMATPEVLPLRSDLQFKEGSRETILGSWDKSTGDLKFNLRQNADVAGIKKDGAIFTITLANKQTLTADAVVLAIGLQGNIRTLGVPGETGPNAQYQLDDPEEYKNETIVVIGAGDAGLENAIALAVQNEVIVVNVMGDFARAKAGNVALIESAIKDGRIQCYFNTKVIKVETDPSAIFLKTPEGEAVVKCHRVIARIGAMPPRKFVEACGIVFPNADPASVPGVSDSYESNVKGLYIIGALAGYPLIKHCMNQGYEVIEYILGHEVKPADEPLLEAKLTGLQGVTVSQFLEGVQQRVPMFSALTKLQLREFLLDSDVHAPKKGEIVFKHNDYSDSFYSILSGSVDVQVSAENPAIKVTLKTGEFFGEMGLISGRRRTATVVAGADCVLIETPRRQVIKLTRSIAAAKRVLDETATIRQVQTHLAPQVSKRDLVDVVRTATIQSFSAGDVLIKEGDIGDNVYLIRSGSVTVSRNLGGRDVVLSYVPAGHYVGEMALLTKSPRTATVRAAVATEVIKLDGGAFRDLLDRSPELRVEVESRFQARLVENARMEGRPDHSNLMQFLLDQGLGEATDVLLIDETLCVRCDNCEKACAETHHGVSRLDREAGPTYASIHVPTSCRHCEHPHCMSDCPADAIHRSPNGEVFIDEKCIGCGNCERNCPYHVIHMSAEPPAKPGLLAWMLFGLGHGPGEDWEATHGKKKDPNKRKMAVKCDMCKGIEGGPSCVRACPTGAAIRVSPEEFFSLSNRGL